MVLDSNLLYLNRRMTLITFQDGTVVMRDGKVGTEQACCCEPCFRLVLTPEILGPLSDACIAALFEIQREKLEAAGWTVGELETDENPNFVSMPIYCSCCIDCERLSNALERHEPATPNILSRQPVGAWADVGAYVLPQGPLVVQPDPPDPCFVEYEGCNTDNLLALTDFALAPGCDSLPAFSWQRFTQINDIEVPCELPYFIPVCSPTSVWCAPEVCYELVETECDGDCPENSTPTDPLVALEFSSEECGSGGSASVAIGCGGILSAAVTDGGSGYATVTYDEPQLSLSVPGGSGGVLDIDGYFLRTTGGAAGYYGIISVSVTTGGSGYTDGTISTLTLGADDVQFPTSAPAEIRIRTVLVPPDDDWILSPVGGAAGTGLVVSLTLARPFPEAEYQEATAASVVSGGTSYTVGETYEATAVDGGTEEPAEIEITSVGSGGVVTGVSIFYGGHFADIDTGVIDRCEFVDDWQGAYRKAEVEVCGVDVSVTQTAPSDGTGATFNLVVEDDPLDPDFGKVVGITVTAAGSDYVALCERTTGVLSCDDCPALESPESSTCGENLLP